MCVSNYSSQGVDGSTDTSRLQVLSGCISPHTETTRRFNQEIRVGLIVVVSSMLVSNTPNHINPQNREDPKTLDGSCILAFRVNGSSRPAAQS